MAKLTSSLGIKPCVAGQPVPVGTVVPWDKNVPIPDGYLDCSIQNTTIDINKYQEYYERFKTNTLPYYPPTGTHRMIIKLKEYAVGEVINADSLAGRHWNDFQLRENVLGGIKNKIINGNFDIWQRGTSQTTSGYGSDDRWINENVGSTKVHSQQPFPLGQTEVPCNPKYFSRTVITSVAGAGNYCLKYQKIENVTLLSGKTVTLSFYAKSDTNKNIAVEFMQQFGTGGTPSSVIRGVGGVGVTIFNLTTSWEKYTVTVTIPSVYGKILGTNGNDAFYVIFWFEAGSNFSFYSNNLGQQSGTFDLAQIQLEEGDKATPFEQRHIQQELALCQRYFEYGVAFIIGNAYTSSVDIGNVINFAVTKRTNPTITFDTALENVNISNLLVWPTIFGFRYHGNNTVAGNAYITRVFYADAEL